MKFKERKEMADENENSCDKYDEVKPGEFYQSQSLPLPFLINFLSFSDKMFTLKKWNSVAMWSWDVECDTCAICRVQVMGE